MIWIVASCQSNAHEWRPIIYDWHANESRLCETAEELKSALLHGCAVYPGPDLRTVELARQAAREGRGSTIDDILDDAVKR